MTDLKPGDVIPIRFVNTKLPSCLAQVLTVIGHVVTYRYLDGVFYGLRGHVTLHRKRIAMRASARRAP